jgi:hypothetical protein
MNAVNLTVDVLCSRSCQSILNRDETTLYRLYFNNDLLTERTWIWKNNICVKENIWVYTKTTNLLTIQPIINLPEPAIFTLSNLQVIDTMFTFEQINEHTISFTL